MDKLYLSRRNITTLLQKLDSVRAGQSSPCTIIKNDVSHPVYPQTTRRIAVTAVEEGDQFFSGVSQRLHLSRSTLNALSANLDGQIVGGVEVGGIQIIAVPDDEYYAQDGQGTPVGLVTSSMTKKWR